MIASQSQPPERSDKKRKVKDEKGAQACSTTNNDTDTDTATTTTTTPTTTTNNYISDTNSSLSEEKLNEIIHKDAQDVLESELKCAICQDTYINPMILNCSHSFCKFCVHRWLSRKTFCPECRVGVAFKAENLALRNIVNKMVQKSSPQFRTNFTATFTQRLKDEEAQEKETSLKREGPVSGDQNEARGSDTRRTAALSLRVPRGQRLDLRIHRVVSEINHIINNSGTETDSDQDYGLPPRSRRAQRDAGEENFTFLFRHSNDPTASFLRDDESLSSHTDDDSDSEDDSNSEEFESNSDTDGAPIEIDSDSSDDSDSSEDSQMSDIFWQAVRGDHEDTSNYEEEEEDDDEDVVVSEFDDADDEDNGMDWGDDDVDVVESESESGSESDSESETDDNIDVEDEEHPMVMNGSDSSDSDDSTEVYDLRDRYRYSDESTVQYGTDDDYDDDDDSSTGMPAI